MSAEQWRAVPGYDGAYEVSDLGNVRSWKTYGNTKIGRSAEPHPLKTHAHNGYPGITLSSHGTYTSYRVHRLVMQLFVGPCPDGYEVAHNDGDPANARLSNLRYATKRENNQDKILHGTSLRGEDHNLAKLTEAQAVEIIRRLDAGGRRAQIAREFGISRTHVGQIARGDRWSHLSSDLEARSKATQTCPNGHERTPANLYVRTEKGYEVKRCRECSNASGRAYRARKRQGVAA